jgi:hypothetical protein
VSTKPKLKSAVSNGVIVRQSVSCGHCYETFFTSKRCKLVCLLLEPFKALSYICGLGLGREY